MYSQWNLHCAWRRCDNFTRRGAIFCCTDANDANRRGHCVRLHGTRPSAHRRPGAGADHANNALVSRVHRERQRPNSHHALWDWWRQPSDKPVVKRALDYFLFFFFADAFGFLTTAGSSFSGGSIPFSSSRLRPGVGVKHAGSIP